MNLGSMNEAIIGLKEEIDYVESAKHAADIFTKGFLPNKWIHAVKMLGFHIEGGELPFFMQTVSTEDQLLRSPEVSDLPCRSGPAANAVAEVKELQDHQPSEAMCRGAWAACGII